MGQDGKHRSGGRGACTPPVVTGLCQAFVPGVLARVLDSAPPRSLRRHTQCEAMTSHYEICILLIEFEEDKFGLRVSESGGER